MHVFQYVPDKLRALENMINALNVKGTLLLRPVGDFEIDSKQYHLRGYGDANEVGDISHDFIDILNSCPGINVRLTQEGGLMIVKTQNVPANFPFDYLGNSMLDPNGTFSDIIRGKPSNKFELRSHYRYNPNRKPKW